MDIRISKSRAALKSALLELMKKKKITRISIKELCQKAGLNRSTFYDNYADIYALLSDIHQDIFDGMNAFLENSYPRYGKDVHPSHVEILTDILDYLKDNQNTFQLLLTNNEGNLFERHLSEYYLEKYLPANADYELYCRILYHTIGSLTLIHHWFSDGFPCSSAELARIINNLSNDSEGLSYAKLSLTKS